MQIEEIVEHYPKTVKLKDGSPITLRPLQPSDEKESHPLFVGVPDQEVTLYKHRVTEPYVIREWCSKIDYTKIFPGVAVAGGKTAAAPPLHRARGGFTSHIGRISV